MSDRSIRLFGANARAFNSREPEVLLAGAAGSGKTLAWLAKALALADKYAGARILIVRKTRHSLTDSVLVTWEQRVLGEGHPILQMSKRQRENQYAYRHPNGSEFVLGGMDKPDKVLSSEYDLILCPEATDLELTDWETLGGRLRNGRVPFQQLAGDCNPTTPHHWLYKRQATGLLKMYTSLHQDNPKYFDRKTGEWTEEGAVYQARLERMTGTRRDRFLKGLWVSAEGLVYDFRGQPEFDKAGNPTHPGHMLPADFEAPLSWPRVWAIDWGKTAPTVLGVWAVDPEGRMYLVREVYQTRLRPDSLGKRAKAWVESGKEPHPMAIVCDHDEERKADFEKVSGLTVDLADKRDRDKGIEATQARFDLADDGRPRIFFKPDCRENDPDRFLVDHGKPCSTVEELVGYVWDPNFLKDEPIAENDHGCDALRYSARYIDTHSIGLPADPNPYGTPKRDREHERMMA